MFGDEMHIPIHLRQSHNSYSSAAIAVDEDVHWDVPYRWIFDSFALCGIIICIILPSLERLPPYNSPYSCHHQSGLSVQRFALK